MSIFKDTFRNYVRDQLSLREEIIDIGNTDDNRGRISRTSTPEITLQSGKVIKNLDAGAFYNYTLNKQCIIRATSLVDYVENVNLEIGGLEGEQSFNALRGASLSQNFILEGGVLSDFARVKNGKKEVRRVTTPRDSFPRPGQRTNLGYGDLAIGADATSDGYGIVPMPGIIDVNVRTKSAYGSLREAKVNFECHNRRQLEVLEMLYMRPGYMVVLEWGWTPYINNEGTLYKEKRLLEDISDGRIYTNNITQQEVFSYINKLKEFHCGNYDGFLGFVKNFGFQARNDGGYSCYTELVSIGEVIESLKIPNISITDPAINIPSSNNKSVGGSSNIRIESDIQYGGSMLGQQYIDEAKFNNALEAGIFPRYNGLLGLIKSLSNYCVFNEFSRGVGTTGNLGTRNIDFENQQLNKIFTTEDTETYDAASDDQKEVINTRRVELRSIAKRDGYDYNIFRNYLKDLVRYQSTNLEEYLLKTLQLPSNNDLLNYIIPIGGQSAYKYKDNNNNRKRSTQSYIRWDALCILINENLITKDAKANNPIYVVSDRVYDKGEGFAKLDPLLYTPISDYTSTPNNSLLDFSCDANICILPVQFETNTLANVGGNVDAYKIEETLGYIPDTSVFPANYIVGVYDKGLPIKYNNLEITPNNLTDNSSNSIILTRTDQLRRIGSIFLNINMLNDIAEKNAEEEDYTLGKFLNDIWNEVNKVCPNHNFVVTDDKESNTVFVIDLPIDNSEVPLDLHEFIPFSNKNTLRKFEYTSNVPKALSATVAIQAQDPRSIQDIDGVTFAAFNRAIKNRILSDDTRSDFAKTKQAIKNNEQNVISKQSQLRIQIDRYILRFFENLKLISNEREPVGEGNIKGILKEYQKNASYLSTVMTGINTFNSVIPLEFNATLDGISGIVIGNIFKVQKDRLPKAYGKTNIGFIIFNEDQKISGQDWITDISGKMIILPDKNQPKIIGVSSNIDTTYIDEDILNETSVSLSGNSDLDPDQERITDIAQVTDGEPVFLKKMKDNSLLGIDIVGLIPDYKYFGRAGYQNDLPYTLDNHVIGTTHGYASVRNEPTVNNTVFDTFRGMFNSWDDGGMLLGFVKPDGVLTQEFENGKVRLLNSKYGDYFNLAEEDIQDDELITFVPNKIDGKSTKNINGIEYYVVTKPISPNHDMYNILDPTGDMILSTDTTTERYIKVDDTTKTSSVWYNIQFDPSVDEKFHNGWAREGNWLDPTGAGFSVPKGILLSEFSKANDCWMRFDILAATADSATKITILETNSEFEPDPNAGPQTS